MIKEKDLNYVSLKTQKERERERKRQPKYLKRYNQVRDSNAQTQKLLRTSSGLTVNIQQKIINNAKPRDIIKRWIKTKGKKKILKVTRG